MFPTEEDNVSPTQEMEQKELENNPYYQAKIQREGREKSRFLASVDTGLDTTPDQQAEYNQLAKEHKVPADFIKENYDEFKKKSVTKNNYNYDDIKKQNPYLAQWLQKPENASLTADEIDHIKNMEKKARSLNKSKESRTDAFMLGAMESYTNTQKLYSIHKVDTGDESGFEEWAEFNRKAKEKQAPKFYQEYQKRVQKESKDLERIFDEIEQSKKKLEQDKIMEGLVGIAKGYIKVPGEFFDVISQYDSRSAWYEAGSSLNSVVIPGLASMGASALAAKVSTPIAGAMALTPAAPAAPFVAAGVPAVAGATTFYNMSSTIQYLSSVDKYLAEKKIDTTDPEALRKAWKDPKLREIVRDMALTKARVNAFIETGFNLAGVGIAKKAFKGASIAKKGARFATGQAADIVGAPTGEMVSEVAVKGELTPEMIQSGAQELMGELTLGGGGLVVGQAWSQTVNSAKEIKVLNDKVEDAQGFQETVEGLVEVVNESKIKDRDADAMVDLVANASGQAEVFLQADDFKNHWENLGEDPLAKADELLPGGRNDLEASLESGRDIKVPIADVITKFSQEESFKDFASIMKSSPDALTGKRAGELKGAIPAMLMEVAQQAKREHELEVTRQQAEQTVLSEVQYQLTEAGVKKKDAKKLSSLYAAGMNAIGKAMGKDALEVYQQLGLDVRFFESMPEAETLLQADRPGRFTLKEGETIVDEVNAIESVTMPTIEVATKAKEVDAYNIAEGTKGIFKNTSVNNTYTSKNFTVAPEAIDKFFSRVDDRTLRRFESAQQRKIRESQAKFVASLSSVKNMGAMIENAIPVAQKGDIISFFSMAEMPVAGETVYVGMKFDVDPDGRIVEMENMSTGASFFTPKEVTPAGPGATNISITDFREFINAGRRDESILFQKDQDKQVLKQLNLDPLGFYSKLEAEVLNMDFGTIPAKNLRQRIYDKKDGKITPKIPGLKAEEIEFTGLDLYLEAKEQEGVKVSKDEIVTYLKNNGLRLKEVVRSDEIQGEDIQALREEMLPKYGIESWPEFFRVASDEDIARVNAAESVRTTQAPKYRQYVEEGGENYREVLLQMPVDTKEEVTLKWREGTGPNLLETDIEGLAYFIREEGDMLTLFRNGDEIGAYYEEAKAQEDAREDASDYIYKRNRTKGFQSSHWDEENVLAHFRLLDRIGPNGEKILDIQEIQSDWHQAGRKKGYREEGKIQPTKEAVEKQSQIFVEDFRAWKKAVNEKHAINPMALSWLRASITGEEIFSHMEKAAEKQKEVVEEVLNDEDLAPLARKFKESYSEYISIKTERETFGTVPDAPFKKTEAWMELSFKRIAQMAAAQGYDTITWTPGEVQAERYDLSKQISLISYTKQEGSTDRYLILAEDMNGNQVHDKVLDSQEMEDTIGKEMTQKILDDESGEGRLEGLDLKTGGKGMIDLYDKMLPKLVNNWAAGLLGMSKKEAKKANLVKPLSIKTKDTPLIGGGVSAKQAAMSLALADGHSFNDLPPSMQEKYYQKAEAASVGGGVFQQVWSIELTPEMKQEILKGQPLFQDDAGGPRGFLDRSQPGKLLMGLLKDANESTVLHEMGHAFLETLKLVEDELRSLDDLDPDQVKFMKALDDMLEEFGLESLSQVGTPEHELFARTFEAYLMEGQAPSLRLRGIFKTFRAWLINIYRDIRGIEDAAGTGLPLTPAMTEMFDRMLATEEEIVEASNKVNFTAPKDFLDVLGYKRDSDMRERLEKAYEEAEEEAILELYKEQVKQRKQQETKKYNEKKKELRIKYTEQAEATPLFIAIDAIRTGELDGQPLLGGGNLKMNTDALKEFLNVDEMRSFPRSLYTAEGIDPEIVADIVGYPSAQALIGDIKNSPTKEQWIAAKTKQELDRHFPNFLNGEQQAQLKEEAINAVHNDKRTKLLKLQMEAMLQSSPAQARQLIEKFAQKLPTDKQIRAEAERRIMEMTIAESTPNTFKSVENKLAKMSMKQMLKGDMEGAVSSKLAELYNHEMYRKAAELKDSNEKKIKKAKKRFSIPDSKINKKKLNNDMFKVAQAILAQYGLMTDTQVGNIQEYLEKLQAYDATAFAKVSTLISILTPIEAMPFQQLTHQELNDILDTVEALHDLAEAENNIIVDGKPVLLEDAINGLIEEAAKVKQKAVKRESTKWEKFKGAASSLDAIVTRVEHLVNFLSDGNVDGAFYKYVYGTAELAQQDYTDTLAQQMEKIVEILKGPLKGITSDKKKIDITKYFPGVDPTNGTLTRSELTMVLLHSGNESNLKKLIVGRNWGTEDINGDLNTKAYDAFINDMIAQGYITKDMMDGVQAIWDMFEDFKPRIQQTHKRTTGTFFTEIEARPLQTPWGEYRGGYAPAVTDPLLVEAQAERENMASVEQDLNTFTFSQAPKGFTKSRVNYNKALSLDLSLIKNHVEKTVRYATLEGMLYDLNKVFNNAALSDVMFEKNNNWKTEVFKPWLARLATQRTSQPADSKIGRHTTRFLGFMRQSMVSQLMFGNIANTIEQLVDFGPLALEIEVGRMWEKSKKLAFKSEREAIMENIKNLSPYMRQRLDDDIHLLNQSYKEILDYQEGVLGKLDTVQDFASKHTFILQKSLDNYMTIAAWSAAYDQYLVEYNDTKKAAKKADAIIRRVIGSGRPIDVSNAETGRVLEKLILTFYGYFNNKLNLVRYSKEGSRAKYYAMGMAIPAVGSAILQRVLRGKREDEEDDEWYEEFWDIAVMSQVRFSAATLPGGGSMLRFVEGQLNDKPYDDRLNISPVVSGLESITGVKGLLTKEDIRSKDIRDTLTFLGVISGIPLRQAGKSIGFLIDLEQGKQRAEGPLDYSRGIMFGRSGLK